MKVDFSHPWESETQLGAGGFGRVFVATGDDGVATVAKFVPKVSGAEYELLFVHLDNVQNVVPVIDYRDTGDHWSLVMPRADWSLRDEPTDRAAAATRCAPRGLFDKAAGFAPDPLRALQPPCLTAEALPRSPDPPITLS